MTTEQRQEAMAASLARVQGAKATESEEQPKPVETPAVEAPAAEAPKTEPDGTVEAPATQDTEDYSFDEESPVGARDLAAKLDADPALKAALSPEIRNEILANARIAERLAPYEQIFASPEEAKVIVETANEHAAFAEAYSQISRDVEKGTSAFVAKLIEGSALRNEDGSIRKNEDGSIKTDGTAGKFLDKIFERGFALKVAKKVEALNDENVSAAFDLVMESVGLRPSTADQDQSQDPALAARKAELDAQEARIRTQEQTANKEAYKQHQAAVDGESLSQFQTALTGLMGQATALSPLERKAVEGQINAEFTAALKRGDPRSTAYYTRLDRIRQEPLSAARRQKEVALAAQFTREKLVTIAKPFFKEAGVSVGKKAEERAAAQAAREQAARSEVGGGRAVQPGNGSVAEIDEAAASRAFKESTGRLPSGETEIRYGKALAAMKARP